MKVLPLVEKPISDDTDDAHLREERNLGFPVVVIAGTA